MYFMILLSLIFCNIDIVKYRNSEIINKVFLLITKFNPFD